jgi:NAD(P)-dependent dehydrogenase (short-subunit alcohol dehydrogenase family)
VASVGQLRSRLRGLDAVSRLLGSRLEWFLGTQRKQPGDRGRIIAGRPGTVEEIAAAAVFLVSDDATYVNGTTLYVDGGWTATL